MDDNSKASVNLILTVVISLMVGFIIGYFLQSSRVNIFQSKLDVFEARERAIQNTTAPADGASANVPKDVLNSLTAPTR